MPDVVKYFLENDPLKTAVEVIDSAHFGKRKTQDSQTSQGTESEKPISISFLLWTTIFIALAKTLYGDAGFTFLQHFWTTLFIVLVLYLAAGIALVIVINIRGKNFDYARANNQLRCVLTCLLASLIVSLCLVFASDSITRFSTHTTNFIGLSFEWRAFFGDMSLAALASAIGCLAIFVMKAEKGGVSWYLLFPYWFVTSWVFFFLAFDRGWFFVNIMQYSFKIIPA